jgi:hypothetical protein
MFAILKDRAIEAPCRLTKTSNTIFGGSIQQRRLTHTWRSSTLAPAVLDPCSVFWRGTKQLRGKRSIQNDRGLMQAIFSSVPGCGLPCLLAL